MLAILLGAMKLFVPAIDQRNHLCLVWSALASHVKSCGVHFRHAAGYAHHREYAAGAGKSIWPQQAPRPANVAAAKRLSAITLRYCNAEGADLCGELGECRGLETHIIPLILASARGEAAPLTIFGADYATPDGTCIHDYIHVCDLADAHVRTLTYLDRQSGFNLGTATGSSIRQLITAAEFITSRAVPYSLEIIMLTTWYWLEQ